MCSARREASVRCSPRTRGFELRTTLSRGQHFAIGSADVLPVYDCTRVGMVFEGAYMRFHRSWASTYE